MFLDEITNNNSTDHVRTITAISYSFRQVLNATKDRKVRRSFAYDMYRFYHEELNMRLDKNFYGLLGSSLTKKIMGIKTEDLTTEQKLLRELLIEKYNTSSWNNLHKMPEHIVKLVRNLTKKSWAKQLKNTRDVCRTSELLDVLDLPKLDTLIRKGNQQASTLLTTALKG